MAEPPRRRDRFHGAILGVGTSSGVRCVVGRWDVSPFGSFADVMVALPDGTRVLLAPSQEVAGYVAATYTFDRVTLGDVAVAGRGVWHVAAPGLVLRVRVGGRSPLGWLLRAVPTPLATSTAWAQLTDPVAAVVLRGVRTRGSAGHGRTETYGATDLHRVLSVSGRWQGRDLGTLAPVAPDPGFGFGSTPETPSMTQLVTTIER